MRYHKDWVNELNGNKVYNRRNIISRIFFILYYTETGKFINGSRDLETNGYKHRSLPTIICLSYYILRYACHTRFVIYMLAVASVNRKSLDKLMHTMMMTLITIANIPNIQYQRYPPSDSAVRFPYLSYRNHELLKQGKRTFYHAYKFPSTARRAARALFQYPIRRLIARCQKVEKIEKSRAFIFSIAQSLLNMTCASAALLPAWLSNFSAMRWFKPTILRLRVFEISRFIGYRYRTQYV